MGLIYFQGGGLKNFFGGVKNFRGLRNFRGGREIFGGVRNFRGG